MFNYTGAIKLSRSLVSLFFLFSPIAVSAGDLVQSNLSLTQTVNAALAKDPWLIGNQHSQDAVEAMSIAAGSLPDPTITIGLANIAADTFDFAQEGMTHFKIGVSQMFPRGHSRKIRKQQLSLIESQFPHLREDRKARVSVIITKLWLDVYQAEQSIALINNDRSLFEQLVDVAQAGYSAAYGKTRQQDLVRAQLELTRLDDRLTILKQYAEMSQQRLSEWLSSYPGADESDQTPELLPLGSGSEQIVKLPNISMLNEPLFTSQSTIDTNALFARFIKHPAVAALEQKHQASKSGVNLAKQKYKPQWGVNIGYGFRDAVPNGLDRSDLFSAGVSFDLPLFTKNRQDQQVQSAISKSASVKTEKWLLIRKLIAGFESSRAQLVRLMERQTLYQGRLLPQIRDQAEASLSAYTNDDGDFAEVVRSRIAELNSAIDALAINVEIQKSIAQLNYYFMDSAEQIILMVSEQASIKLAMQDITQGETND